MTMSLKKTSIVTALSDGFVFYVQVPESVPVSDLSSRQPSLQAVEPTAPSQVIDIMATTALSPNQQPHSAALEPPTATLGHTFSAPPTPSVDPSLTVQGQVAANAALHVELQTHTGAAPVGETQLEGFMGAALPSSPLLPPPAPLPLAS